MRNPRTPGERLRAWREEKNVSQSQLAKWLHVHQTLVARWENGEAKPKLEPAISLARLSDGKLPVQAWV